ncbi:PilZ domain-containing protein [Myxococcota bacterium]
MTKLGRIVPSQAPAVEHRAAPRVSAELDVRVRITAADVAYWGKTTNISTAGSYVATRSPTPVGADLDFELYVEGSLLPLQLGGRVVRHGGEHEPPGMGVSFLWLSHAALVLIARLVDRGG